MTLFRTGRGIILCAVLLLLSTGAQVRAQSGTREARWRFGLIGGLNYNMLGLGYQHLDTGSIPNFYFFKGIDGSGIAPYIALLGEYNSRSWWGGQLRLSYDARNGLVTDNTLPAEKKFDAHVSYLSIEPLLRINPGVDNLYAVVGPLIGINLSGKFDYTGAPGEAVQPDQTITDINPVTVGLSGGLGYDMVLGGRSDNPRWYLAPFLEGSWMLHQRGHSFPQISQDKFDDIWSTVTVRAGVALKLGIMAPEDLTDGASPELINLALLAPSRFLTSRKYEEFFPLVTSVFFDSTGSAIPDRYKKMAKDDALKFSENDIIDPTKVGNIDAAQRKAEQMNVYYNVMNIYGARMIANPATALTLIGSAPDVKDGAAMAQGVKDYLTNNFAIDPARISITDNGELPRNPSGSARTPAADRPLAREENRRVEFVTKPTELGTPVNINTVDQSPTENDIVLNINDDPRIKTWQVVITGEGKRETYGPFDHAQQRIDPKAVMEGLDKGHFTAEVIAVTTDGQRVTQTKEFDLVRREQPAKQARRFSIIFGYGQDDPVRLYENFLRNTVAPKIDAGAKVYVVGHTDNIGDAGLNYSLSGNRAGQVGDVLKDELRKLGRSAMFEVVGNGETETRTTFDNGRPEGRFYNRGVVIEVIPND
ncbi:MAG: OmpA family protein [Bacteroidota bacterium]